MCETGICDRADPIRELFLYDLGGNGVKKIQNAKNEMFNTRKGEGQEGGYWGILPRKRRRKSGRGRTREDASLKS